MVVSEAAPPPGGERPSTAAPAGGESQCLRQSPSARECSHWLGEIIRLQKNSMPARHAILMQVVPSTTHWPLFLLHLRKCLVGVQLSGTVFGVPRGRGAHREPRARGERRVPCL